MYMNAEKQRLYYDKIIDSKPKRIIFNPGAENVELAKLARENKIAITSACTLVMLSTGTY